jgi:hypothetical protein
VIGVGDGFGFLTASAATVAGAGSIGYAGAGVLVVDAAAVLGIPAQPDIIVVPDAADFSEVPRPVIRKTRKRTEGILVPAEDFQAETAEDS